MRVRRARDHTSRSEPRNYETPSCFRLDLTHSLDLRTLLYTTPSLSLITLTR